MIRRWTLRVVAASILLAIYAVGFGLCHRFLTPVAVSSIPKKESGFVGIQSDPGMKFASLWQEGAVRLWNVEAGTEIRLELGPKDRVFELAGSWYRYKAASKTLTNFDPATGGDLARIDLDFLPRAEFPECGENPAGKLLYCEKAGGVTVWDPKTGERERILSDVRFKSAVSSPSGRYLELRLYRGGPPASLVVDFETGESVGELSKGMHYADAIFAADDSMVASPMPADKYGKTIPGGLILIYSLPDLRLLGVFEDAILRRMSAKEGVVLDEGSRIRIVRPEDGSETFELKHPARRPAGFPAVLRSATQSLRGDRRVVVSQWSLVELLPLGESVRSRLRGLPLTKLQVALSTLHAPDGSIEAEFLHLPGGDERPPTGGFYHEEDGSRAMFALGDRYAVFERPFRKRWPAIATYPLLPVAFCMGVFWLTRAAWRLMTKARGMGAVS